MASAAMFSSLRRRRSPTVEAFLAPVDISDAAVLETLRAISAEVVSSFSDALRDVEFAEAAPTVFLCLKEMHLLLYRCKILIDYVDVSSKLWLLLQNHSISGHFHDLNQEISTLLDVFPLGEISLSEDVKEHIELLCNQARRSKIFIDDHDDWLGLRLYHFFDEFDHGRIPESTELHNFFVENLGICSVKSCRAEIEFLEEMIVNHGGDLEPTASILYGFVAIMRYCRFLLFDSEDEEDELGNWSYRTVKKGLVMQEIAETFVAVPKDFCCPISLDLMHDPVVISTGQTYDRTSISRWMQEGHCTCPKSGQMLAHTKLVPNRALQKLMMQWCMGNGIASDTPQNSDYVSANSSSALTSRAAAVAVKATTRLLVEQLSNGSQRAMTVAAREIRWLAKTGRANRACIAESGAIPLLKTLLSSSNPVTQENCITAMLNLSIYEKNKSTIMDVEGCLGEIVGVLRNGHTTEARENAAATLFSLSAVHDYKKLIAREDGAVKALVGLLKEGTWRGKKDAVTALFNLSTHTENCASLIEAGAIAALVEVLGQDEVSEEAAGVLAIIVRQPLGAAAVGGEEATVSGLIGMMRCGTARGKENAVAALLELCRSGGAAATERVVKAPALAGLLQSLLFTGTRRARRKAASLARVFQRCEYASFRYSLAGSSAVGMDTSFAGDATMAVPVL
ncbi:U-box domain-containing protein 17-like isoform X2 [Andrographis paniculata]|uniref:U-box domain-containing protein 17-like isoform X2 n=1 Tax=Andrographis paniculata TaxID=175694 RepID=UPI0021E84604|nr:U-box domain-containing protein 17-like isoform X2 [Andrographis paniculata]